MDDIEQINKTVLCWICKAPIETDEHKAICKRCSRQLKRRSKDWIKEPDSPSSGESVVVSLTPFPRR